MIKTEPLSEELKGKPEKLEMYIADLGSLAEQFLIKHGFYEERIRMHGNIAGISRVTVL